MTGREVYELMVEAQRTSERFINGSIVLPTYEACWAVSLVEPYMYVENIDFEYIADRLRLRTIVYDGLKLVWAPDLFYALSKFDPEYRGIKADHCMVSIPEDIFHILNDLEILDAVYYVKGSSVFISSDEDLRRNRDGIADFVRRANSKRILTKPIAFVKILADRLRLTITKYLD